VEDSGWEYIQQGSILQKGDRRGARSTSRKRSMTRNVTQRLKHGRILRNAKWTRHLELEMSGFSTDEVLSMLNLVRAQEVSFEKGGNELADYVAFSMEKEICS